MGWVATSTKGLTLCVVLALGAACTEEVTERPVFVGPDEMPGLRAGGVQDIAAYDRAFRSGIPKPTDFDLAGWLNHQVTALPAADPDHDLSLHAMAAVRQVPAVSGMKGVVQVGLGSRRLLPTRFEPNATAEHIGLVLAIDESGSMATGQRLARLRQGLRLLLDNLPEGVKFGVVGFAGGARDLWPAKAWQSGQHLVATKAAVAGLTASGGTNTHAGLARALAMARAMPADLVHRHVVLITDGRPSRGQVDPDRLTALLDGTSGVGLSVIGIGEEIDDLLLRRLAARGGGATWLVGDESHLNWAPLDAYRSIDGPVVESVQVEVTMLVDGWTVASAPGLKMEAFSAGPGQGVRIRQPLARARQPTSAVDSGATDICATPDEASVTVAAAATDGVFSLRPAVGHPGLFLLRIETHNNPTAADLSGLELARVKVSYVPAVAVTGTSAPVTLEGVVRLSASGDLNAEPDGFVVSSSDVARRSLALFDAGRGLATALELWNLAYLTNQPKGSSARDLRKAAMDVLAPVLEHLIREQEALNMGADGACAKFTDAAELQNCAAGLDPGDGLSDATQRVEELAAKMALLDKAAADCP